MFYLFTFQMLFPFSVSPPETPYPILPPPASMRVLSHPHNHPTSPPWHCPTLGHQAFTGPRASPPIDVTQGHPLLNMQLEAGAIGPSMYTLVAGLVPRSSEGTGWFLLWGCKVLQLLGSFL